MGKMNPQRVRGVVGRLRRRESIPLDPHAIERSVLDALRDSPATHHLSLRVHALGDGLVELTGTAPDAASRRAAGETARTVRGAEVVVNRILIEGDEISAEKSIPPKAR
jgi:osmotically-inducible protein OsmY